MDPDIARIEETEAYDGFFEAMQIAKSVIYKLKIDLNDREETIKDLRADNDDLMKRIDQLIDQSREV